VFCVLEAPCCLHILQYWHIPTELIIVLEYSIRLNILYTGIFHPTEYFPALRQRQVSNSALDATGGSGGSGGSSELVMDVADTGVGMKKKYLKKLFSFFFKIDESRGLNPTGSGIGLAISKQVLV
jgi:signal transduction histidine kinase